MKLKKRNFKRGFSTLYGEGGGWANKPLFTPPDWCQACNRPQWSEYAGTF